MEVDEIFVNFIKTLMFSRD